MICNFLDSYSLVIVKVSVVHEFHATSFRLLEARANWLPRYCVVLSWVFVNVFPDTIYVYCASFHCELERVTIALLQQTATHAKRDVADAETFFNQTINNLANVIDVDAITLNHTYSIKNLVALAIVREAKVMCKTAYKLYWRFYWITRVRANYPSRTRGAQTFFVLRSDVVNEVHNVVAVCYSREDRAFASKLVEHALNQILFAVTTVRSSCAMLSSRNAESRHFFVVANVCCHDASSRVATHEVDQMRCAAKRCTLKA